MTGAIYSGIIYDIKNLWFDKSSYYYNSSLKLWDRLIITFLKITALLCYSNGRFKNEFQELQSKTLNVDMSAENYKETFLIPIEQEFREKTTVVVVVPIYLTSKNSLLQARAVLKCLAGQTISPMAVVVVDDASPFQYEYEEIFPTDSTDSYINIIYIKLEKNGGPGNARNHGINVAFTLNPVLIMFTDMDCQPFQFWVESAIEYFENNRQKYGNCMILSGLTQSLGDTHFDLYHDLFGTLNGLYLPSDESLLYGTTCNLCAPTQLLKAMTFDEDFQKASFEDVEFCIRARKLFNTKTLFVEKMKIYHDFAYISIIDKKWWKSLNAFKDNYIRFGRLFQKYGEWEPLMLAKHYEYNSWRVGLDVIHLNQF
ncbi:7460_t:CDS:2 [Diversispora eburnea]|uniref:7460_t:CDS:1 n=1 Tax=Diversispora eburnea TaxID=1213867 RepID=A0A9N9C3E6_9GLOM|nr:7460_t:CDS:2 [Diversispora eburnea]